MRKIIAIGGLSQQPRCKQRGVKLTALQSSRVFDAAVAKCACKHAHLARCPRE